MLNPTSFRVPAAVLGLTFAASASAAVIGFEAPTYAPGDLMGQDGWTFNADTNAVVAEGGQQVVVSGGNGGTSQRNQRNLSSADIGVSDNTALGDQVIDASIDVRLDSFGSSAGNANTLRLDLAFNNEASDLFSLGRIAVRAQFGELRIDNQHYGGVFTNATEFVTITQRLDFGDGTFDVFADGDLVVAGVAMGSADRDSFNQVRIEKANANAGPNANTRWYTVDNLAYSVVPEPASAALAGASLLLIAGRRRPAAAR